MPVEQDLWRLLLIERLSEYACRDTHRALAACLVEDMAAFLKSHGVRQTPLVVLRVHDVLASFLDVLGAEETLAATDEPKTAAVESAAKARERLRKAMKELEESCERLGSPIGKGLADAMKPILKASEGVLEDALAYEAKRTASSAKEQKKDE